MALWIIERNAVGGWDVRLEGTDSRAARAPDRARATKHAVELATKAGGGRVLVHGVRQEVIEEIDVPGPATGTARFSFTKGEDVLVKQRESHVWEEGPNPQRSARPQRPKEFARQGKGAVEIQELVEGYRRAAEQVDAIPDPIERQVAQAALRLNASATLSHVTPRGEGISADVIEPLQVWVSHYVGGERAEKVVSLIEKKAAEFAKSALRDVFLWAVAGKTIAIGIGVLGMIAGAGLFFVETGYNLMTAVLAGVIPAGVVSALIRLAAQGGPVFTQAVQATWERASQLGSEGLAIFNQTTLDLERRVWALSGGAPHPSVPFIMRARSRAQGLVGGVIGLCVAGLLLFSAGAFSAYSDWEQQQSGEPLGVGTQRPTSGGGTYVNEIAASLTLVMSTG